jgi:hypothetical protein
MSPEAAHPLKRPTPPAPANPAFFIIVESDEDDEYEDDTVDLGDQGSLPVKLNAA